MQNNTFFKKTKQNKIKSLSFPSQHFCILSLVSSRELDWTHFKFTPELNHSFLRLGLDLKVKQDDHAHSPEQPHEGCCTVHSRALILQDKSHLHETFTGEKVVEKQQN